LILVLVSRKIIEKTHRKTLAAQSEAGQESEEAGNRGEAR
jgi:hypothetical protein